MLFFHQMRTLVLAVMLVVVEAGTLRLRTENTGDATVAVDVNGDLRINSAPGHRVFINDIDISSLVANLTELQAQLGAIERTSSQLPQTASLDVSTDAHDSTRVVLTPRAPYALTMPGMYRITPTSSIPVRLMAWGAGGGRGTYSSGDTDGRGNPDGTSDTENVGGAGGYTMCTMTLSQGRTYTVVVGTGGASTTSGSNGGDIIHGLGGGFSGIFETAGTTTQENALLIAGGGGGGGYGDWSRAGGGGGAAGQAASFNSHNGAGASNNAAGLGGSQSAGGAGGTQTCGASGAAGSALQGGSSAGSSASDANACSGLFGGGGCTHDCPGGNYDGGAGGGGYWGGGGGACCWAASGGGGSGYIRPHLCMESATAQATYEAPAEADDLDRVTHAPNAGAPQQPGFVVIVKA